MRYFIVFTAYLFISFASLLYAAPSAQYAPIEKMVNDVITHRFSNGLNLIMLEDHSAPVITLQLWVKTGSRNEHPGITGISHLFEHMMFRGSKKYGPEEHSKLVKRYGGELNAFTTEDVTVYFETIASDQLELVIHLEAERFANLILNDEVLKEEKNVVSEERRMRVDNDVFGSAIEQLTSNFYRTSSYSWPVIGWMHDILNYSLQDVQEYYRLHYSPNNIIAVLVGDFKAEEAIAKFEKYWGKIPSQPTPPPPLMVEVPQTGEKRIIYKRQTEVPYLFAAFQIPEMTHPDIAALEILSMILSSGQSSRLYQRLVHQEQIARFAGGDADTKLGPGMFTFYVGLKPNSDLQRAESILWDEIEKIRSSLPSESELVKARNRYENNLIRGLNSTMSRAFLLGTAEAKYGNYRKILEQIEAYEKVTAQDIQRVANEYLHPDKRTVLMVIPNNHTSNTYGD
ncbi:MAG: insulinase family protein [bacterium]|nr:insulinase family protein [bacterium]